MKTRPLIVRVGAIASSLALAGAYVSCRSVGTHADSHTSQDPPAPAAEKAPDRTLFYGTKSGPIELPAAPPQQQAQPQAPAPTAPRTLMPGSKSLSPMISPSSPSQTSTPPR